MCLMHAFVCAWDIQETETGRGAVAQDPVCSYSALACREKTRTNVQWDEVPSCSQQGLLLQANSSRVCQLGTDDFCRTAVVLPLPLCNLARQVPMLRTWLGCFIYS